MIFGNTMLMSEKSLDYLWKKQEVTMGNIANAETPNYKKKYISFEEVFQKKLQTASNLKDSQSIRNAIKETDYQIYVRNDSTRVDQNNVSLDVEYSELSRTALQYQYVLQSINSDITRLRTVIKGQ